MKPWIPLIAAAFVAISAQQSHAQTLNWNVPVGETIVDSKGIGINPPIKDENGDAINDDFVFELGAFALNYNPQEANVSEWLTHWRVFDALTYDNTFGFTSSTVFIQNGVTSSSIKPNVSNESFAGLKAYIWIRNGDEPVAGSEWFVGRAIDWTFPSQGGDCCATNTITWSIDDLGPGEVPAWGRQYEIKPGPGESTFKGPLDGLQTHTFPIPEPSSALLTFIAGIGLILRRRRNA